MCSTSKRVLITFSEGAAEAAGSCAPAGGTRIARIAALSTMAAARHTARNLLGGVIKRDFQGLQETHVLWSHLKLRLFALFVQNFLVHLDVQRFEEAAIPRGDLGIVGIA